MNLRSRLGWTWLVWVILLTEVIALQWFSGSYRVEFSGYPDEPAHYITGLMIHDYLQSGFEQSPMRYAEDYYLHYPKVAFGIWPPLFHGIEALWMLLFSEQRVSVLLYLACITSLLALSLYIRLKREYPAGWAFGAAALLVTIPIVQVSNSNLMMDMLIALLSFQAVLALGEFFDQGKLRHAVWFGIWAGLSLSTKGNSGALILAPPLALLLTRQWNLLKRPAFWLPVPIVILIAGPWQYLMIRLWTGTVDSGTSGWEFFSEALPVYSMGLYRETGIALLAAALVGAVLKLKAARVEGRWAVMLALPVCVIVFHSMIAIPTETRYLTVALPPVLMLAVAGLHRAGKWAPALGLAVVALFGLQVFTMPHKPAHGYREAVPHLLVLTAPHDEPLLISSNYDGEGMLIAEVAMHESERPGRIVLRASKLLSQSNWTGGHYTLLYNSPEEVDRYLRSISVAVVVLDRRPGPETKPHHALLEAMLRQFPEWKKQASYTGSNGQVELEVFRYTGPRITDREKIRIDMRYTLGRTIEQ